MRLYYNARRGDMCSYDKWDTASDDRADGDREDRRERK